MKQQVHRPATVESGGCQEGVVAKPADDIEKAGESLLDAKMCHDSGETENREQHKDMDSQEGMETIVIHVPPGFLSS